MVYVYRLGPPRSFNEKKKKDTFTASYETYP